MTSATQHLVSVLFIVLVLGFSMYRRIRRNIMWQKFVPSRMMTRSIVFLILTLFIGVGMLRLPNVLPYMGLGVVLGAVLALVSERLTLFRQGASGIEFRPNPWIGGALILLFVARIAVRFVTIGSIPTASTAAGSNPFLSVYGQDPLFLGTIFLIFAYYCLYGLLTALRGRRRMMLQAESINDAVRRS